MGEDGIVIDCFMMTCQRSLCLSLLISAQLLVPPTLIFLSSFSLSFLFSILPSFFFLRSIFYFLSFSSFFFFLSLSDLSFSLLFIFLLVLSSFFISLYFCYCLLLFLSCYRSLSPLFPPIHPFSFFLSSLPALRLHV